MKKGLFSNYFKPSLYVRSFMDINVSQLKRQGIELFISDLDNTLVPHFKRLPNKDVLNFIEKITNANIKFVILSNNAKTRVKTFATKAGVREWYSNARKPFKFVVKKIIKKHKIHPSKVIIMGDQIVMDILVANRLKCESILVQPLVSSDYKMNRFNLFLENRIYKSLERNNILKHGEFDYELLGRERQLL